MAPQVFMNYIHSSSLLNQLSSLWKCDQLCDAVITVDNCIIAKAHKLVLLAVSPKLKNDSESTTQNSTILDVSLPSGVHHKSVHALLQYLYEGFLIITEDIAKDLMKIAEFLEIKCLFKCCHEFCLKSFDDTPEVPVENSVWLNTKNEDYSHVRKSKYDSFPGGNKKRRKSSESSIDNSKRKSIKECRKSSDSTPVNISRSEHLGENDEMQQKGSEFHEGSMSTKTFSKDRPTSCSQDNVDEEQFDGQSFQVHKTMTQNSELNPINSNCTSNSDSELINIKHETEFEPCAGQTVFDTSMSTSIDDVSSNRDNEEFLRTVKVEPSSDDSNDCQLVDFSEASDRSSTSHNITDKNGEIRQWSITGDGSFYMSSGQVKKKQKIYYAPQDHEMSASLETGETDDGGNTSMSFTGDAQYIGGSEQMSSAQGQKSGQFSEQYHNAYQTYAVTPKMYPCSICGVSFSQRSNLTRHSRIHTEEKPHVCDICGRSFRRSDYLQGHVLTVHGIMPRKKRR